MTLLHSTPPVGFRARHPSLTPRPGDADAPPATVAFRRTLTLGWVLSSLLLLAVGPLASRLRAQGAPVSFSSDNPTGAAGQFNGNVATGCSYDPLTGNASRTIVDLTVPGATGAYGLAFARTTNSRFIGGIDFLFGEGGNWRHNFQYELTLQYVPAQGTTNWVVDYPDGRHVVFAAADGNDPRYQDSPVKPPSTLLYGPLGTADRLDFHDTDNPWLLLPDGGRVLFRAYYSTALGMNAYRPISIGDPFGNSIHIDYWNDSTSWVSIVTEPGGRWLRLDYSQPRPGLAAIVSVTAWNGQTVTYNYGSWASGDPANSGGAYAVLTAANYLAEPQGGVAGNPPVQATYGYGADVSGGPPLLARCNDPHFPGAMWSIAYSFDNDTNVWGRVLQEQSPWSGEMVSMLNSRMPLDEIGGVTRGEIRGDRGADGEGLSRSFGYYPGTGFLHYFTDYQSGRRVFQYDRYGYRWTVNDWRNWQTVITHEPNVGAVTAVTLPPDAHGVSHRRSFGYTDPLYPYYLSTRIDENGQATSYDRDGLGRVWRIRYPDGGFEQFSYDSGPDGCGQVSAHRLTTGGTVVCRYGRSAAGTRGLLMSKDEPNGDGGTSTTTYAYDSLDRLRTVTDARGNQTVYDYNGRHQITRVTHPQDPSRQRYPDGQPGANFVSSTYDDLGNLTSVTDECGHTGTTTYDNYRRPTVTQDALGHSVFFSYECRNRAGAVTVNPYAHTRADWATRMTPSYTNGARFKHAFRAFDGFQRVATEVIGLGGTDGNWPNVVSGADASRNNHGYDPDGHPLWDQDGMGRVANYAVDSRGRLLSKTLPADGQFDRTYRYDYDGAGNLLSETRPDGTLFRHACDQMNRRWWTQDPALHVTRTIFGYEPGGVGTTLTTIDPNNNAYVAHADSLGRKTRMDFPGGFQESWHYDAVGNQDRFTNRAGQVKTLTYDNRNWLTRTAWNTGGRAVDWVRYSDGQPIYAYTSEGVSLAFSRDAASRLTTQWLSPDSGLPFEHAADSTYDDDNTRVGLAYHGGDTQTFAYTDRQQLATIGFDGGTLAWFSYAADGLIATRGLWNGTSTSYGFDGGARLGQLVHHRTGNINDVVTGRDYGYDSLTRRTWAKKREDGRGDAYYYQADDQLYLAREEAYGVDTGNLSGDLRRNGFAYDDAGNRTISDDSAATGRIYYTNTDVLNRYRTLNGQAVGYDANSNLSYEPLSASTYIYDADNHLVRAVNAQTGLDRSFGYDALDRCVWRQDNGGPKSYFYYDGANLIEERNQSGSRLNRYAYGLGTDQPITLRRADGIDLCYHQDANNNVVALTDGGGSVVERYSYDSFGRPYVLDGAGGYTRGDQSAYGNRFMFTGREWQAALKLYDYRARIYSPALGRFLQSDPIGFGGGNHLYRYGSNNPVNKVDPNGTKDFGDLVDSVGGSPYPSAPNSATGDGKPAFVSIGSGGVYPPSRTGGLTPIEEVIIGGLIVAGAAPLVAPVVAEAGIVAGGLVEGGAAGGAAAVVGGGVKLGIDATNKYGAYGDQGLSLLALLKALNNAINATEYNSEHPEEAQAGLQAMQFWLPTRPLAPSSKPVLTGKPGVFPGSNQLSNGGYTWGTANTYTNYTATPLNSFMSGSIASSFFGSAGGSFTPGITFGLGGVVRVRSVRECRTNRMAVA